MFLIGRDGLDFGEITYEQNGTWPGFNQRHPFYRVGTLYAVYNFLEELCGVRWYMVTDLGTVIPQKTTLDFKPMEKQSKPWTYYRNTTRNVWQKPGQVPNQNVPMTPCSQKDNNLFVLRCRLGGEPYSVNHSVEDFHKRFGKKHPDWFVGGKPGPHIQPRFDNPEVIDQIVKDADAFFSIPYSSRKFGANINHASRISAGHFFSVCPLDNRDFGKNLTPPLQQERRIIGNYGTGVASNFIFTAVNKVARKVAEKYPDQWISTFAYSDMFEPPEFPMAPNVAVTVCNVDGWEEGDYGLKILKEWRKKVSRIFVWEYYLEMQERFPRFMPHAIARYLTNLADMGLDGWFSEMPSFFGKGLHRNPALYHINAYITYLMLRKKGVNIDKELDEYYSLFYGPAQKPMKKFWQILESVNSRESDNSLRNMGSLKLWSAKELEKRMAAMEKELSKAESLAIAEPYKSRLKIVRETVFDMLESRRKNYVKVAKTPNPVLQTGKITQPINIDGKIDEEIWQKIGRVTFWRPELRIVF